VASIDTKAKLLTTAERLFALEGIGAVSTRRISKEAGQRNNSALHYHFGDKENLIDAIIAARMAVVNARREEMLQALEQGKKTNVLREVLRALVQPLAEQLEQDNYYAAFLDQFYSYTRIDSLLEATVPHVSGMQRAAKYLAPHLKALPKAIVAARVDLLSGQIVHHIADWDRQRRRGEALPPLALLVENLVDVLSAGLLAPVSATTAALLRTRRKK
jgi:AcrR family transcriptional regulator